MEKRTRIKAEKRRKKLEEERALKGLPLPQRRYGRGVEAKKKRHAKTAAAAEATEKAEQDAKAAQVAKEAAEKAATKKAQKAVKAVAKKVIAKEARAKGEPTAAQYKVRDIIIVNN